MATKGASPSTTLPLSPCSHATPPQGFTKRNLRLLWDKNDLIHPYKKGILIAKALVTPCLEALIENPRAWCKPRENPGTGPGALTLPPLPPGHGSKDQIRHVGPTGGRRDGSPVPKTFGKVKPVIHLNPASRRARPRGLRGVPLRQPGLANRGGHA